ncbi:hypothetical protein NDU88_005748 [Pleurodeles waltl]|uniref:Secreted protein n=1 Tax=Pleurodeles waltl TaxID=8319 RepID=A0AAV7MXM8_PLEWA|nr:hypothetical protein NDU88_005748 [Pleurodeles waltl]
MVRSSDAWLRSTAFCAFISLTRFYFWDICVLDVVVGTVRMAPLPTSVVDPSNKVKGKCESLADYVGLRWVRQVPGCSEGGLVRLCQSEIRGVLDKSL